MRYNEQINLKLFTYENSAFVQQAIIDDYQEISFAHNLYEAGDFTITINYNIPNALKFERGMFIQFGNDPCMFGEILTINDSIGEDGKGSQLRTITGKDARYIFKRRIIKNLNNVENWAMTAKGELCLRNLINDQCGSGAETKRQLPITNTIPDSASALGNEYSVAESFSNLYDTLVTIATQSEIGWRIKFDGNLTLEVYQGTDLSDEVQFSTDFDSLSNGEFSDSAESFANTIYVGGKGTGNDRDIYEGESAISGESPAGLERYEAFDNQTSMTTESEYEAEALSMLTQYGQTITVAGQGLAKCPYEFKKEYNIGDTITLSFSGKSAKVQILSVTEHWVWGQYGIEFSFGKPQNDLSRQLQLILKQIQKASNKTKTTESVKYYTIPTDTAMPSADVVYDRIGFTGACAQNGSTFRLYLDDEKTGAKTYHVYFKQLTGGQLTLTTGKEGATDLVLNSGTYVSIIYVDAEGNVSCAGSTATTTITSGNNQPATSGGVAEALSNYDKFYRIQTGTRDKIYKLGTTIYADVYQAFTNIYMRGGRVDNIFGEGFITLYGTQYVWSRLLANLGTIEIILTLENGQMTVYAKILTWSTLLFNVADTSNFNVDIQEVSQISGTVIWNNAWEPVATFTDLAQIRKRGTIGNLTYFNFSNDAQLSQFDGLVLLSTRNTSNFILMYCSFTLQSIMITAVISNNGITFDADNIWGTIAVSGLSATPSDNLFLLIPSA